MANAAKLAPAVKPGLFDSLSQLPKAPLFLRKEHRYIILWQVGANRHLLHFGIISS